MSNTIVILKNEFDDGHENWSLSCTQLGETFRVLDVRSTNCISEIIDQQPKLILTCPSGREALYKQLYDEKVYILDKVLSIPCYPSYDEIILHENKKFLSYWLTANKIDHPRTWVFYDKFEALDFAKNYKGSKIIGKFSIGASGKGVKLIKDKDSLLEYINNSFDKGISQNWGPNMKMGNFTGRFMKLIKDPNRLQKRIEVYKKNAAEKQKGFVIFQEFVQHDFEWRIVKIGNSFFGHKKIKQGEMASGTKGIDYVDVPPNLLSYIQELCADHGFQCMAIDLFDDTNGGYLINEMQCIFGHVQKFICAVNDKPGRYKIVNSKWIFEEGYFNGNLSYDLRLENALSLLK